MREGVFGPMSNPSRVIRRLPRAPDGCIYAQLESGHWVLAHYGLQYERQQVVAQRLEVLGRCYWCPDGHRRRNKSMYDPVITAIIEGRPTPVSMADPAQPSPSRAGGR
jgi:hypothetical protein